MASLRRLKVTFDSFEDLVESIGPGLSRTHLLAPTDEAIADGTRVRLEIGTIRKGALIRGVAKVAGSAGDTSRPGLHLHLIHLDPSSTRLVDSVVRGEIAGVSAGESRGPSPFEIPSTEPALSEPEASNPELEPTEPEAPEPKPVKPEPTEPAPKPIEPETTAPETVAPEPAGPEPTEPETMAPETTAPEPAAPEPAAPEPAAPESWEQPPPEPESELTEPESPAESAAPATAAAAAPATREWRLGWPLALVALAGFLLLTFQLIIDRDGDPLLTGRDRRTEAAEPEPVPPTAVTLRDTTEAGTVEEAEPGASPTQNDPSDPEDPNPGDRRSPKAADEIESAVFAWAEAWTSQDPTAYIELYAPDYSPVGLDRGNWERQRRARIIAPERLEVSISDLKIEVVGPERAIARFHQLYATDDKTLAARKVLELERSSGGWRIVGERLER